MVRIVKTKKIVLCIIGLIFSFFTMFSTYNDGSSYPIIILGMIIYFIYFFKNSIRLSNFNLLQIMVGLIFIINGLCLAKDLGRNFALFFGTLCFFSVFLQGNSICLSHYFIPFCFVFSVIYVSMTFFQLFYNEQFLSFAKIVLSSEQYQTMIICSFSGAYAGLTGQTQTNGWMISIGICYLLVVFFLEKRKKIKVLSFILLLLFYFALVLTHKRDLMLIPFFIGIVYLFCLNKPVFKKNIVPIVMATILLIIVFVILYKEVPEIRASFIRFTIEGNYGGKDISSGRFYRWKQTLPIFYAHPLLGVGIYNSMNYLNGGLPHSIYLQLLAEIGLIPSILVYIMFFYGLYISINNYKKAQETNKKNILFSIFIQFVFLLEGLTENVIGQAIYSAMYLICLSISLGKNNFLDLEGKYEKNMYCVR